MLAIIVFAGRESARSHKPGREAHSQNEVVGFFCFGMKGNPNGSRDN
jgi:hypothetical protein